MPFVNSSPSEISLFPVGLVLIPVKLRSIVPVNPPTTITLLTVAAWLGSAVKKLKTLPVFVTPEWSWVSLVVGFKNNEQQIEYYQGSPSTPL